MMRAARSSVAGLVLAGLARAAAAAPAADLAPLQSGLDYHSFANTEQFRVTHVELDLRVDFTNQVLFGEVALVVKRLDPGATELVLDTRDLDIRDVSEKPRNVLGALSKSETTWVSRPFHFDKADPILGSPLVIELPPHSKSTETIKIEYVTSPASPALQWLTDKQTVGRHHPFMYTLSYPTGARGWIPMQDTPRIRATYSATIHTDRDVLAVMSARNDPKAKRNGEYSFVMQDAIPTCFLALAVGDLRFKEIGPRTGVYAQKPMLERAFKQFGDAETLLRSAEKLAGPYRFDRYDIVVMPRSFPVAEAGNPGAAFVTPASLTGDKGMPPAALETLAQSWAGGLVNGASWRDAWIDAGLAGYLRERLMEDAYGAPAAAAASWFVLRDLRESLARDPAADQALAVDLRGRDPRTVSRRRAALKAELFFDQLERKFGRDAFEDFVRGYFAHFAFESVDTEQFLAYLDDHLLSRHPGVLTRAQAAVWVNGPGIPPDAVFPQSNAFDSVDAARGAWLAGKIPAKKLDARGWSTEQWIYFLRAMPAVLRKDQLAELDQAFGLSGSANAEVAGSWFLLVIRAAYQPAFPRLEEYLESTGLRSLITPLYVELMKTPAGAALAQRVFALAKPFYQAGAAAALDPIVHPESESEDDE